MICSFGSLWLSVFQEFPIKMQVLLGGLDIKFLVLDTLASPLEVEN